MDKPDPLDPEQIVELLKALQYERDTNVRLLKSVPHDRLAEKTAALWAVAVKLARAFEDPIATTMCMEIFTETNELVRAYNYDEQLVITTVEDEK